MFLAVYDYVWGDSVEPDLETMEVRKQEKEDSKHVTDDSALIDNDWVMVEQLSPAPGNLETHFTISEDEPMANKTVAKKALPCEIEVEDVNANNEQNTRQHRTIDQDLFKNENTVQHGGRNCRKNLTRKALETSNKCIFVGRNQNIRNQQ